MKKIAIPVEKGKLSPHFGHAPFFYFYHTENNTVIKEQMLTPPPHEFGSIPKWLVENNVTDLIVGGIGPKAIDILNSENINVFTGAAVDEPKKILSEFLSGTLKMNENLCNHDENHTCEH